MSSIFSKIINGEIPSYKVAETPKFLAFLDVFPLAHGHILVIPKKEIDYIFDIDDTDLQEMILFAKQIAKALKKAVACERIGVAVIGLEVPHAHMHLVPINTANDLNFTKPKLKVTAQELTLMAEKIKSKI
ncbi:MAG: HIT family protein [Bacteroidia bacterium]